MKTRPDHDEYFSAIAAVVATRGTCVRRRVGCVLVNEKNHILATGYNGPPAKRFHCTRENPCGDAALAPSGTALGSCAAVHAEQNALLQCPNVADIRTAYVTVSPCEHCVKMLLNTGCRRIVFVGKYAGAEQAQAWWEEDGRIWDQIFYDNEGGPPIEQVFSIHERYQALYGKAP
jgi:dCMP deaminase